MKQLAVLKSQSSYRRMILSNAVNRFGDSIDCIALTWLIFELTGEASWSALLFGINRLPTIFLMPFAGVIVEKHNKKRLMTIMDGIRGLCVGIIASLLLVGALNKWLLLLFTFLISTAEAFRIPAATAFIPEILEKDYYEQGLSLDSSICTIVELIGTGLAGVIIATTGTVGAIYLDMLTFILSAVIILSIPYRSQPVTVSTAEKGHFITELKEGFNYLFNNKILKYFAISSLFLNGILVPFNSLQAPLVSDLLSSGEIMLSVLSVSFMLGMVVGASLYPTLSKRLGQKTVYRLGILSVGFYYFSFVIEARFIHSVVLLTLIVATISFVFGIFIAAISCLVHIEIMKHVDTPYLARVSALCTALGVAIIPATSFLVGGLSKYLSIETIFTISTILDIIVCSLLCSNKRMPFTASDLKKGDCYTHDKNNSNACQCG